MKPIALSLSIICVVLPSILTAARPTTPSRLDNLVVIEAEDFLGEHGEKPLVRDRAPENNIGKLHLLTHGEASNKAFLCPLGRDLRMKGTFAKPVTAKADIIIPSAGRWYLHVRYFVTPERWGHGGRVNVRQLATQQPYYRMLAPFKVKIDTDEFTCGKDQSKGKAFRQDQFSLDLKEGNHTVTIEMPDVSGPDCLVFTKNKDYKPQPEDYDGPVWVRFKLLKGIDKPFYIECNCVTNPFSRISFVAGYLVKDRIVKVKKNLSLLIAEQKPAKPESLDVGDEFDIIEEKPKEPFLQKGQWSPWIETFRSGAQTCYTHAKFVPAKGKVSRGVLKYGTTNLTVEFQTATKPDERFVIRQGIEKTGKAAGVTILMPDRTDLNGLRQWVKSYNQWAEDRVKEIEKMNFKPDQGPRKIMVMTDSYVNVEADVGSVIMCCSLLGFNGLSLSARFIDTKTLWKLLKKHGFYWTAVHHIALLKNVFETLVQQSLDGKDAKTVIHKIIEEKSRERTEGYLSRIPKELVETKKLIILADEPGAMPHVIYINAIPQLKQYFHDFLRKNKLTPEFFGKKSWDEVDACGYSKREISPESELGKHLKALGLKINNVTDEDVANAPSQIDQVMDQEGDQLLGVKKVDIHELEEARQIDLRIRRSVDGKATTKYEKRRYHWTQMFRGEFTRLWYGTCAQVVPKMFNKKGQIDQTYRISPNFQAMPMMATQMWDGALNLFTWAGTNTTNFLMMEDWINGTYRVAFGLSLLTAAGKKNGQEHGFLIVGNRYEKARYLTGLALDCRLFYSYSYGLMRIKGPAWSNSPTIVRDWGEVLRWTRNVEDQLLASRNRPSQVALLVANTSEINTAYFNANNAVVNPGFRFFSRPLFQRAAIYSALMDAGIPVDIIGEADIAERDQLNHYKLLYVVDPHVRTDTQEKIRDWVADGGVLWGTYAALARKEYDEDTTILNEAFGLKSRGKLPVLTDPISRETKPQTITVRKSGLLDPVVINDLGAKLDWTLSTAKPLASFTDDRSAIVHNSFGKGQTFLVGCSAYAFSRTGGVTSESPDFKALQKIVTAPFVSAGCERPLQLNQPEILSFIKDGTDFSVIFLINASGIDKQAITARFKTKKKVKSLKTCRVETIPFKNDNSGITFNWPALKDNDGIIFVVQY